MRDDWRRHAESGRWDAIVVERVPEEDWPELLRRVCAVVPRATRQDGMESVEDFLDQRETEDGQIRHAAAIRAQLAVMLHQEADWLQEALAAFVDILERPDVQDIEGVWGLDPLEKLDRLEPDRKLTPVWHAWSGLADMLEFHKTVITLRQPPEDPFSEEELRRELRIAAQLGVKIGRHWQCLWSKPFEPDAVRGQGTVKSASAGGRARSLQVNEEREIEARVEHMRDLLAKGKKVSDAAKAAERHVGGTASANRRLCYRRRLVR